MGRETLPKVREMGFGTGFHRLLADVLCLAGCSIPILKIL